MVRGKSSDNFETETEYFLLANSDGHTGTGTIIAAYPLLPGMSFRDERHIFVPISNFYCIEQCWK